MGWVAQGWSTLPLPLVFCSMEVAAVQRRTLGVLFFTQIIGGVGSAIGASVGALLAAEIVGIGLSGVAQSANVVGAALFAVPATTIVQRHGRRPSLAAGYFVAALGAAIVFAAAVRHSPALLFPGFFLFGGASAATYQARYAAVDLAPTPVRGRHLSLIVWGTTLGAIVGPSLAALAGAAVEPHGVPTIAGPFFFSALLFGLATLILLALLRPDPAIVARTATPVTGQPASGGIGMRGAWRTVSAHPSARLGVSAMATGHLVMVGVMSMTPVHIRGAGHDASHTLRIVGVVLSLHIAGMFAFAPVVGWLTDRLGRRPVVAAGLAVLLVACAVAGTAGHGSVQLAVGMTLLGLGWSGTMVAGSTLLSESVPREVSAAAQGLSDLVMGLAGALAGALSGVVLESWGYPRLTLIAALATAPLLALLWWSVKVSGDVKTSALPRA
jgi:MFS family permease